MMALLSALEIYKLLPKTDCKCCGQPTCMAFAIKLAAKKAVPLECPHLDPDIQKKLTETSEAGIKSTKIGDMCIGKQTVLFRHQETFYDPPAIAVELDSNLPKEELVKKIENITNVRFKHGGKEIQIDLIALKDSDGNLNTYLQTLKTVLEKSKLSLVLKTNFLKIAEEALKLSLSKKPLLYYRGEDTPGLIQLTQKYKVPVVITGESPKAILEKTVEFQKNKLKDLVLNLNTQSKLEQLHFLVNSRRLTLKKKELLWAYPILVDLDLKKNLSVINEGAVYLLKYANLLIFKEIDLENLLPLFVLRENIFSDPRSPIQVEAKLYKIGKVTEKSPVAVTTNFSLTYFIVSSEIEASKIPCYLLIVDTQGTSVLSAWAAGRFTAKNVTDAINNTNLEKIVSHKRIIIPGYVSVLKDDLSQTSGWQVDVGPKEAKGLGSYLNKYSL